MQSPIVVAEEVRNALAARQPVVALETCVLTQGLPYPHNEKAASMIEAAVRNEGAVPAFVAMLAGKAVVGANVEEVAKLVRERPPKVSRRGIAITAARGEDGGTTVSATAHIARIAGIDVFATGGIGGVHTGAGESFDISEDIAALASNSICVVCSGAKSILDLPATLEALESAGVQVVGLGTSDFPAFFPPTSGLRVQRGLATTAEAAAVFKLSRSFGLASALLVTVPPPVRVAMAAVEVGRAVVEANHLAEERGISGSELTPFLFSEMIQLTQGRSLKANISLLEANASFAARIAADLLH
jgi:pseudouridine-5'-phosphate glycosidase